MRRRHDAPRTVLRLRRRLTIEAQLARILDNQEKIMAAIQTVQDYTTQINENLTKLNIEVTALDAKIQALQAQIGGGLSAADQALLQAVVDQSAALVTQASLPAPPAPAPTTPAAP